MGWKHAEEKNDAVWMCIWNNWRPFEDHERDDKLRRYESKWNLWVTEETLNRMKAERGMLCERVFQMIGYRLEIM